MSLCVPAGLGPAVVCSHKASPPPPYRLRDKSPASQSGPAAHSTGPWLLAVQPGDNGHSQGALNRVDSAPFVSHTAQPPKTVPSVSKAPALPVWMAQPPGYQEASLFGRLRVMPAESSIVRPHRDSSARQGPSFTQAVHKGP